MCRHYPNVYQKIKDEINLNKAKKIGLTNSKEKKKKKNVKEENQILKEKIKLLKKENEELLVANIALAERIRFLNNKVK